MKRGNIVLGVSGSIAAFKAAALASDMVKAGLHVRPVLTMGATRFITPLTFEAITGHAAGVTVWDEGPGSTRMGHIDLGRWADLLVVAPASANTIARLALGLADDLLGAVALTTRAPLLLAPAMETGMYGSPAIQGHLELLRTRGAETIGPESGRLASGASGQGRMSEPHDILQRVLAMLARSRSLAGKRVLVTAGPTFEAIDPVRFIGNRSSGKMGYAVAEEAAARGADVTLVSGPTSLLPPVHVTTIAVESAEDMSREVLTRARTQDVVVMAAAVADFRPASVSPSKVKRSGNLTIELEATDDIARAAAGAAPRAIHVGFALESGDLEGGAKSKLERKGIDLVVANLISSEHNPFGSDHNTVSFVTRDTVTRLPPMPKRDVARRLWDIVESMLAERSATAEE